MKPGWSSIVAALAYTLGSPSVMAYSPAMEQCLLEQMAAVHADTTVETVMRTCELRLDASTTHSSPRLSGRESNSPLSRRITAESGIMDRPYTLTTHWPTYILPYAYNANPNQDPFDFVGSDDVVEREEVQFQISFKVPVVRELFRSRADLLFAYTNRSWWQVYNGGFSAPFRETNHEPEIFLRHYAGPGLKKYNVAGFDWGLVHQSNGRTQLLSRSWNRVFAAMALDFGDVALGLKAWYRVPEDEESDDNPHMHRYLGYGEARAIYAPNRNTWTAMVRPGTEKFSYELTWSYPLTDVLRLYAHYFNGYGESLLDYDHRSERIGIGISLNDYLQR